MTSTSHTVLKNWQTELNKQSNHNSRGAWISLKVSYCISVYIHGWIVHSYSWLVLTTKLWILPEVNRESAVEWETLVTVVVIGWMHSVTTDDSEDQSELNIQTFLHKMRSCIPLHFTSIVSLRKNAQMCLTIVLASCLFCMAQHSENAKLKLK